MKLFLNDHENQLITNGRQAAEDPDFDPLPVVKLFTPWGGATWLIAWCDPEMPDLLFGLCDLGMGHPECGSVLRSELEGLRGPVGLRVERDLSWTATKSLHAYAMEALDAQRIVA